MEELYFFI